MFDCTVFCFQKKELLNYKKQTFRLGDVVKLKEVQYKLKRILKQAKLNYKRKLEGKLQNNDTRVVWKHMRNITDPGW